MLTGPLGAVLADEGATVVEGVPSADALGELAVPLLVQAAARTTIEIRRLDSAFRATGTADALPTATNVLDEKVGADAAVPLFPDE